MLQRHDSCDNKRYLDTGPQLYTQVTLERATQLWQDMTAAVHCKDKAQIETFYILKFPLTWVMSCIIV